MSWLAVTFEVDAPHVEALSDALLEAGASSVDVTDAAAGSAAERPVFDEPGGDAREGWSRARVRALAPSGTDAAALLAAACARAGVAVPPHGVEPVAERDWVRASREQFRPVRISPRLWIVPGWHEPPDPDAINLVLDPGLAFGTGTHPTTRQCLCWLERVIRGGESVIDYGCGSGILAIAALRLGAAAAQGVDIDEQALLAARANALQNRVPAVFRSAADAIGQPAQIVVANILARPLIVLAPLIARLTAGGGKLALAGLLADQAPTVRAAYAPWFRFDAAVEDEGWVMLEAVRGVR